MNTKDGKLEADKNISQKCFHNRNGNCYYLLSDVTRCKGLCNMFTSFDPELRNKVNKKLKNQENKLGKNDPVDKYRLDIAYGYFPENDLTSQGVI